MARSIERVASGLLGPTGQVVRGLAQRRGALIAIAAVEPPVEMLNTDVSSRKALEIWQKPNSERYRGSFRVRLPWRCLRFIEADIGGLQYMQDFTNRATCLQRRTLVVALLCRLQ